MKAIALFDFCGTIVKTQTIGLFCRQFFKKKQKTPSVLINFYRGLNLFYRHQTISPVWLSLLRGTPLEIIEDFATEFSEELSTHFIIPAVLERIKWHHSQGHMVLIVSAGLSFYVAKVAEKLAIKHVIATELEVNHKVLTGRVNEKGVCYGEQKIGRIYQYFTQEELENIDWNNSYAYTDHSSDLPLLNLVGNQFVVICKDKESSLKREQFNNLIQLIKW